MQTHNTSWRLTLNIFFFFLNIVRARLLFSSDSFEKQQKTKQSHGIWTWERNWLGHTFYIYIYIIRSVFVKRFTVPTWYCIPIIPTSRQNFLLTEFRLNTLVLLLLLFNDHDVQVRFFIFFLLNINVKNIEPLFTERESNNKQFKTLMRILVCANTTANRQTNNILEFIIHRNRWVNVFPWNQFVDGVPRVDVTLGAVLTRS